MAKRSGCPWSSSGSASAILPWQQRHTTPVRAAWRAQEVNLRNFSRRWNYLGTTALPSDPSIVTYTSLKTGVVDAAENNWPSYESSRHYEAAKIYSVTEHSMAPEVLVFSKKVWDGLSKDEQAIIRDAARQSVPYMRKLWDEREASARKTVEAAGSQIVTDVDKKSFSDAMAPVYAKFAADPKLQDLVKRIQATE